MTRSRWWLALAAAVVAGALAVPAMSPALVVRDVTVIDPATGARHMSMDVEVTGDRIMALRPHRWWRLGHRLVIDGRGRFLIPGLWDTHVHLSTLGEPVIPVLVTLGVTSVRDMGGSIAELTSWRDRTARGEMIGPRIRFCGPMLEKPGEYGRDHLVVQGASAARGVVRALARQGVDCIKVRSWQDEETWRALAEAAHEERLPLFGHPPYPVAPLRAATVAQASYEHAFYPWPFGTLPDSSRRAIIEALRRGGVRLVPTLVAWAPATRPPAVLESELSALLPDAAARQFVSPRLLQKWADGAEDSRREGRGSPGWQRAIAQAARDAGEMHRGGVPLLAGTDVGAPFVSPQSALHEELERLVSDAGLTAAAALAAATIGPARLFHLDDQVGAIKEGQQADLVLLTADPLASIGNVRSVHTVIAAGRVYGPDARAAIRAEAVRGLDELWRQEGAK